MEKRRSLPVVVELDSSRDGRIDPQVSEANVDRANGVELALGLLGKKRGAQPELLRHRIVNRKSEELLHFKRGVIRAGSHAAATHVWARSEGYGSAVQLLAVADGNGDDEGGGLAVSGRLC